MAKTFYTERDIDDLHARGVTTLEVNDDVVLTDLARERCEARGIRLVRQAAPGAHPQDAADAELAHRVKAAVIARLGEGVDPKVLDGVVAKVVGGMRKS
jgi:hypothetical protein